MKCIVLVFLYTISIVNIICDVDLRFDPLVKINQGLVRGQKSTVGPKMYSYFLGIPYAQVDLNNPFGPALPPQNFKEEIFDAFEGSIRCPQPDSRLFVYESHLETLDCLRLNIYVPIEASSKNLRPVLVWIHGGGFYEGYAGEYNPHDLAQHDIIVVTINYRLGAYGFMCLDSHLLPGNQGLKDQYEALRWIKNNIVAFGGDPNKVTLAGQSAGAASSLLHLYSDKDKLFNQLIAQSGTHLSEGRFIKGDYDAAIKLATHLGFNTSDTAEALTNLAGASPYDVINAQKKLNLYFSPCREKSFSGVDYFIIDNLFELENEMNIKGTPVIIGHTSMELAGQLNLYGDDYFNTNPFYNRIKNNFNLDEDIYMKAAEIVKNFYVGDKPISINVTLELETFDSDFVFNNPIRRTINNFLKENAEPVFQYLYSYIDNKTLSGADHSSEVKYLFNLENQRSRNEEDQLISDRITTLWANFVKYGNPTPEKTDLLPVTWEPVEKETRPYLVIDTGMRLDSSVFHERMAFWDMFYLAYGEKHKMSSRTSC